MSLYNMVHGENPCADWILHHLRILRREFGRYRDISLCEDVTEGYVVRVLTRNAGSREAYLSTNEKLGKHELYLRQQVDSFDDTYLYFYFKIPKTLVEAIRALGWDLHSKEVPKPIERLIDNQTMKEKSDAIVLLASKIDM